MNVVDGRKLVEHAEGAQSFVYPFGVTTLPRRRPRSGRRAHRALAYIRDINDAVADLVLAEGVHQAVLGNYDRSAGTLDAFAKGNYPPEPEVDPHAANRHRADPSDRAATWRRTPPPALPTPLGRRASPLSRPGWRIISPAAADVGCNVSYTDRGVGTEATRFIDQAQLGLGPSDLLYRGEDGASGALVDLDERILTYRARHLCAAPRP